MNGCYFLCNNELGNGPKCRSTIKDRSFINSWGKGTTGLLLKTGHLLFHGEMALLVFY